MTLSPGRGTKLTGCLLLADISGYTGFLQGVADAHRALIIEADEPPPAFAMMSSLLDAIVSVVVPPFKLEKFEGDAVFATAVDGGPDTAAADAAPSVAAAGLRGPAVLDCLRACHAAFEARLAAARTEWTCECDGCIRVNQLGIKFVIHHGDYVAQQLMGREEVLGADVNIVHRLLKNHARDLVGPRPYALFSDAAIKALDVPVDGMAATTEHYEGLPPIAVRVLAL